MCCFIAASSDTDIHKLMQEREVAKGGSAAASEYTSEKPAPVLPGSSVFGIRMKMFGEKKSETPTNTGNLDQVKLLIE